MQTPVKTMNSSRLHAFVDRVVEDLAASYGGVMVSVGRKLGLYKAMQDGGPLNAVEVARRAGCHERYVREWLNSQAAGGYVIYHPASETYELPPEHAHVIADEDSPMFMAPAWDVPASMWMDEERTLAAFRSGDGVPWGEHDERLFRGSAAFYRNAYRGQLLSDWLPALDGVVDRLRAGATVADIGCGHGHSTVIMAEAFPNSKFVGVDTHESSIRAAQANAREAGVEARTQFGTTGVGTLDAGTFDLVCFFDCLHDMGDPVGAAANARRLLKRDGLAMIVEPFANDRVEDNLTPVGRLYYAASTTLCCAHALSEEGGMSLGAQAGPARLTEVLHRAGFENVRRALATPFNLILEARA